MTAKEYLNQAYILNQSIDKKILKYEQLKSIAMNTVGALTGMPHASGVNDKICDCISKAVDLDREINNDIDRLSELKKEMREKIKEVNSHKERVLLIMRYIQFKSWYDIARQIGCSKNHVRNRLHDKAVCKINI